MKLLGLQNIGGFVVLSGVKNTLTKDEALCLAAELILVCNDDKRLEEICMEIMPERTGDGFEG